MSTKPRAFPYTAHRKGYLVTVVGFGFSICVEIALVTLVIVAVVHNEFVRAILLLAHSGLSLLVIMILVHPLLTKHRLTETHFEIRYGPFRLAVPRDDIQSVKVVREPLTPFQPIKAQVDTKMHRVVAAFSVEGQVLLMLERPLIVKMDKKAVSIKNVLINVNEPDVLLVMLGKNSNICSGVIHQA